MNSIHQSSSQQIGAQAEQRAEVFLCQHGLKFLTRNYRCKMGEIDLIMRDKDTIVFVEVRYRKDLSYGISSETVSYSKQRKLIKAATFYLVANKLWEKISGRFDIVAMNSKHEIDWIKNAFQVEY